MAGQEGTNRGYEGSSNEYRDNLGQQTRNNNQDSDACCGPVQSEMMFCPCYAIVKVA